MRFRFNNAHYETTILPPRLQRPKLQKLSFISTREATMNTQTKSILEDYLIAGISIVAVDATKLPLGKWKHLQEAAMDSSEIDFQFRSAKGVAVICGQVSGGLEIIDFDAHEKDIERIYNEWITEPGVEAIVTRNNCYIERSPRGGWHVAYLYECEGKRDGNRKIANWANAESMIETRGEGGYCITAPTAKYTTIQGSLTELPTISKEERDYLLEIAAKYNQHIKTTSNGNGEPQAGHEYTDPVSWYNWNKSAHAKKLLQDHGWRIIGTSESGEEQWCRPGKEDGISATWGHKHNALYVFTTSAEGFENEHYYTSFQILTKLQFKGNYSDAISWVLTKYDLGENECPYIRVGADYYKKIKKIDRYGIERIELKAWKKDEIRQDNGKDFLKTIPKFDDFVIKPSNFDYMPVVHNCYNLYRPIPYAPAPGQWRWTDILLRHIFGEQYELGLRYMQILYMHPDRMMPILVLVSRERQTGKTTFLNWLNMIFGANVANISPEDLASGFNYTYATSNIVAVEETLIEKSITVEKIKALATMKQITVNQKFVSQFKIPFFGKIILTSNNEDKFARIDEDEIRFFIRKVGMPQNSNHNIEADLLNEIPAFLYHLTQLPPADFTKDRTGFTPEELSNNSLIRVKQESKPGLFKNLCELFYDHFANIKTDEIQAAPIDIKNKWFINNNTVDLQYIKKVLIDDFRISASEKLIRYEPFGDANQKVGTPYTFTREMFNVPENDQFNDYVPF